MSAVICNSNKRSFYEELQQTSSNKRTRRGCSPGSFLSRIDILRPIFPYMDNHILERALEKCDNDIDAAIKRLHELSLGYATENTSAEGTSGSAEKGSSTTDERAADPANSSVQNNSQMGGAEWVELFVGEMMSATSIDDARSRATKILGSLEKSISERAGTEAAQNYKENVMLKEQIEVLLRENNILKRAVSIQHERQKEYDSKDQEVHQLKQMLAQYQEQLRTLEVNNYALTLHLQQAQQNSSMPGRFNPDIF